MALSPGMRLGPYEITAQIGQGGMGEVYRATDTNLGRSVAIKVLPDALALDPDRLARFDREARTLATLNHPNIAGVHGLEKSDGLTALVMELVEGVTLAERISGEPIPLVDALGLARQIAEAIEAAHQQGIVHRDLKPANIKVRPDGTAKVLDFGLAKAVEPAAAGPIGQSFSPTITTPAMTQAGLILGTAAYMSPEQARGKAVDTRADIWAFGCVIYEMLTSRRAFEGEDVSDTLANVLKMEPDWSRLPPGLSTGLVVCLKRCFHKDVRQRIPDIATLRLALEGAFDTPPPQSAEPPDGRRTPPALWRRALPWAAGIVIGLAAGSGLWRPQPVPDRPVVRFDVTPAAEMEMRRGVSLAVSPDGARIVYNAGGRLYSHAFAEGLSEPIRGTEGGAAPFFSPDGSSIGFFTPTELKKVAIGGGIPTALTNVRNGLRGTWADNGTIVYGVRGFTPLFRVRDTGGVAEALTTREAGERDHDFPWFLPGGTWVLFTHGWFPWDSAEIAAVSLETGARQLIQKGGFFPQYVETGHLLYASGGNLWAVPFDRDHLAVTGQATPVVEDVWQTGAGAQFAVSKAGTLAYVSGRTTANAFNFFVWVDRATGKEQPLAMPEGFFLNPSISPDGTRVAFAQGLEGNTDVWIWNDAAQTQTRLTFDDGEEDTPLWMSDGRRIAFRSTRDGGGLFARAADGTGDVEPLAQGDDLWPFAQSPDGRLLLSQPTGALRQLSSVTMRGDRSPQALVTSPFNSPRLDLSPDGRWLAYESDETGSAEIYVRPFPDVQREKTRVSIDGGSRPKWSADGRELFYIGPESMMVTRVETRSSFARTRPEPLFSMSPFLIMGPYANTYSVSPDGRRFLMLKEVVPSDEEARRIRVVEHWTEELKRLAP